MTEPNPKQGHNKKLYKLYCEICNWRMITDGSDAKDLYELKTSPIPQGSPKLDPVTNEVATPKAKNQLKRFRCPKCGRAVIPRKISGEVVKDKKKPEDYNE